jgi:hypothetical protein
MRFSSFAKPLHFFAKGRKMAVLGGTFCIEMLQETDKPTKWGGFSVKYDTQRQGV